MDSKLLVSSPNPQQHVMVIRMPSASDMVISFHDEEGVRSLTAMACDLALMGFSVRNRQEAGLEGVATDVVEVGTVMLSSAEASEVTAYYAHPLSGATEELDWHALAKVLEKGVVAQITAGIAEEASESFDQDPPA